MRSLLQHELYLQKRVREVVNNNPDITLDTICKRFSMGAVRIKNLLKDDPPYPSAYKISAKRIGLPIESVARHKERGEHWCSYCARWFPNKQFSNGGSCISRHISEYCVKGKRK